MGAELFAITATVLRAEMLQRTGAPGAYEAVRLADAFCLGARRRIKRLFRQMRSNLDVSRYRLAQDVLEGGFRWLEEPIVGRQRAAETMVPPTESPREARPPRRVESEVVT